MILGGAVVGVAGGIVILTGRLGPGALLALLGVAVQLAGAWVHDREHRRRGEPPHTLWGPEDRFRPTWLPGRRS